MKATIDIPDDLYRRIKARAALDGRSVREVTVELYRAWLGDAQAVTVAPREWVDEWLAFGAGALGRNRKGPSASELIAQDRARLDR